MKFRFLIPCYVLLLMMALVNSCKKDEPGSTPKGDTDNLQEKITLLNETTKKIDAALSAGDPIAFLGYFSSKYDDLYKDAIQNNSQKLIQFADVFKTRKLLSCDGFYAVYEVQYNGKKFEISMILDDDGNWKLKDL